MVDLSRAIGRFATTPVFGWDAVYGSWENTGLCGRLQVFDRFITERDFGQRKRVLTMPGLVAMPAPFTVVRMGTTPAAYMIESEVSDVEDCEAYATVFTLHQAAYKVQVCKKTTSSSRSGVALNTGEQILATTWVDITRFGSSDSREFNNTDYTTYTIFFPQGTPLDTDSYVRRMDNNEILDINEVFHSLELPAARCQRRG